MTESGALKQKPKKILGKRKKPEKKEEAKESEDETTQEPILRYPRRAGRSTTITNKKTWFNYLSHVLPNTPYTMLYNSWI